MMKSLRNFVLLILILVNFISQSQVSSNYTFAYSAGTYTAITGGTAIYSTSFDDDVTSVSMPSFNFNGTNYTSINVSTNGFITFGATAPSSTGYTPISSSTGYAGAISAFGEDLNESASGSPEIRYETVGNEFVIQWKDVRRFSVGSERISFQIRLNNFNNSISLVYGGTITPGSDVSYPQVGLRGTANTDYNNRSVTASAWSGSSAGGSNTSTCYFNSAQTTYVPASGATYTWTRSTCTPPSTQASALTQSAAGSTTATIGWTRGNGDNTLVVVSTSSSLTADPASGTSYTGNAAFASGTALGGGYAVYAGSGTSVSLTALSSNTQYYVYFFEYNTSGTCYNQAQYSSSFYTSNPNTSLTIGTGTTASSGSFYGPFNNYYENNRTQILYNKSEMGAIAYTISHLALNIKYVTSDANYRDFNNFTIKLMHTSTTSLSAAYENTAGATTVFSNADYAMPTSTGWNTFDITDFAYNGTSNLLVEIVWGDNAEYCSPGDYYTVNCTDYSSAGNYLVTYGVADAETPPNYDGRSYLRPNIKFTIASCSVNAGVSSSSSTSVSACNTTTTLSLTGQDGSTTLQWQWSPDQVNWYNISGLTSSSETSPYISRSTIYFRTAVTNSCVALSVPVSVTSSAATSCNFWEGNVSTSAIATSNWSLATVPASTSTDVLICKGAAYTCTFPSGTDDLDMDDLYIQENATFDNLDDNLTGAIWISGNLTCNGTMSQSTGGQGYYVMLGTSKTITAGGSANMSTARIQISTGAYNATVTLASNIAIHECLVYTTGTLSLSTYTLQCKYFGNNTASSTFNLNSGTLEVGGDPTFDESGAHLTGKTNPYFESGTINVGTGTVFYNAGEDYAAANQTVKSRTYYNLKVRTNNGYTTTVGNGAGLVVSNNFELVNPSTAGGVATLNNAGDFVNVTIGADATLNGGALSHTVSGNWSNSGTFNCSTGTITFDGTSTLTTGGSASTKKFYNVTLNGTSATLAGNIDIDNTLTLTAGTWDVSASNYSMNLGGNFVNNATFTQRSGTVTFDGTSTISGSTATSFYDVIISGTLTGHATSMNITHDYTNNGTYTHNSGTVVFSGSVAQALGGSASSTFYRLTMNNSSATGVSLGVNTTINNQITLTDGLLYTVSYTLTLGTNASNATVPSGSAASYIVAYNNVGTIGYVKQFVNTAASTTYNFPIGEATKFTPLTFTLVSAGGLASANLIIHTKGASITGMNAAVTQYIARQWVVTESGFTTPTYNINYIYDDADIVGTETGLLPIKLSGWTWYKPTGSSFTNGTAQGTGSVNTGTNTLTWTSLTTFSMFGGAVDGGVALPVILYNFDVSNYHGNVKLNWKTSSEINNDHFEIERSDDGENFEFVNQVKGAGNSNYPISYFTIDENYYKGINYYRLTMVDFNGSTTVSPVLSIDMSKKADGVIIMTVNSIGQEVNEDFKGVVFDIYSDGSSVKRIQ